MNLYESSNPLSMPFECFTYDSAANPFPIKLHYHYFAELLIVRSGILTVSSDYKEYIVHPGEAFIIYPNEVHGFDSTDGSRVIYDVVKLDIHQFRESPAYAPELCSVIGEAARQHRTQFFNVEAVQSMQLDKRIAECLREMQERVYGYDLVIKATLYTALMQLLRYWMKEGFSIQLQTLRSDLFGSVMSITSYIESHLRETLKVEDLARYCRMSYPAFARKFRELYGISCKEYIEQVRIARVEHFLLFTNSELTFISQEAGYADCSHMIRDFKRLRGTTPGKFRAEHRGE